MNDCGRPPSLHPHTPTLHSQMSIETIYISLFMIGVSGTLLYLIPYLLLIESVSPDFRSAISGILPLFDDLSLIYLPILYESHRAGELFII